MKQNQKGFTLVEALLLIIALTLIVFTGWYVWNNRDKDQPTTNAIKSTVKSKTAADPTADWKPFTSVEGKYSLRYPTDWAIASNQDACEGGILLLGPTPDTVGKCNSDGVGQMMFYSHEATDDGYLGMKPEGYNDYKVSQVTVDGVQGERYSGIIAEDAEGIGSAKGTKEIRYVFKKDTFVYQAHYFQQPGYPDVEKDFDLVVTKTLKFTK